MTEEKSQESRLPERVRALAVRLTRQANEGEDAVEARSRRETALSAYGYRSRYRSDDETLVLYPDDWHGPDDTIDFSAIEDPTRADEIPLGGAGDPDDWESVAEHNEEIVEAVREEHGELHGRNAEAFATFMNNHRARRIDEAGPDDVAEFRSEYYPRNVWPTEAQRSVLEESLELVFGAVGRDPPERHS